MMNFFGAGKTSGQSDDDDSSWDSEKDYTIGSKTCNSYSSTIVSVALFENVSNHSGTSALERPLSITCNALERPSSITCNALERPSSITCSRTLSSNERSKESEPIEVNYDSDCTRLFSLIQDKNWEAAAECAKSDPMQIQTWVYRKQPGVPNKLRWRLLPIHAMCVFVAPESLMELLLDNYPKAASMKDDQGMLPIHLACRNGSARGVVKLLLDSYPEGFYVKDRKDRTPSDLARASTNFNKEGIIMTLERFQATMESQQKQKDGDTPPPPSVTVETISLQEVDFEHRTTLLKNIIKMDWEAVVSRTVQFPKEASVWTKTKGVNGDIRFLPIHKACVMNPPLEVVEALIAAFPDGVKAVDQDGWLPLHCAAYYRASDPVLFFMIRANLDACKAKDEEGRIPIHYACMKKLSYSVVRTMIEVCPKSLKLKDDEGYTALHFACGHGCSPKVLEILLLTYSKSAQSRDDQGRLPLHHLCCNSEISAPDAESIVRMLLKAFKSAVTIQDDQRKLPMHYACENKNIGKAALQLLYAAYPNAVEVKDGYGYTPITASQAFGNDMDVLLFSFSEDGKGNEENCIESQNVQKKGANSPQKQRNGSVQQPLKSNDGSHCNKPFWQQTISSAGSSPWNSPPHSPLKFRQLGSCSLKESLTTVAEQAREMKSVTSSSTQVQKNVSVETEIASRLHELENVLANFGEAMKTMQIKIDQGEDSK
eukprot:CAMPEP_0172435126 /NCGR_PEP_ID=MMETSP1064-20121228/71007_1 /TAXON_ID=202472 /ORGANISM="Aulacoseira subarctica , Strain CCAP 1002/5" /LENGTH=711 /DNA_ID=CAMNT_0013183407 /DNA_START=36 /DNA_END=2171 /DNA_ORIENTATION=-